MNKLTELLDGFDIQDAMERFNGSEDVLLKYVRLMVRDFLARLPEVRNLLSVGCFDKAAGCLHSLAGSAAALSATQLFDICHGCELCAKNSLADEALLQLEHIWKYICALESLLQAHLKIGGTH